MTIIGASNQGIELGQHTPIAPPNNNIYQYGNAFLSFLSNASGVRFLPCGYSNIALSTSTPPSVLRYTTVFSFPIPVARGSTFSSAILELPALFARSGLTFIVQAYRDQTAPDASSANYSHLQPKGAVSIVFNTATLTNYNSAYTQWSLVGNKITLNIKNLLEEAVAHSTWGNSLGVFRISLSPAAYATPSSNIGDILFYYDEAPAFLGAFIDYTVNPAPTITRVSFDDSIAAGELNVQVDGTNLGAVDRITLYNRDTAIEYALTISSKTATRIYFNMSGAVAVGPNYTFRAYIGIQLAATINVGVRAAAATEPEVVEPPPPTVLTSIDGHEYTLLANPFPGTWESIGTLTTFGSTSNAATTQRIAVGKWNGYYFKLNMKIGPVNVAKNASIFSANLNLSIATCYKYLDLKIQAVDNPNDPDIGVANIISSQTLTTATVTEDNSSWINASATDRWVPQVNPKNINVTSIVQEMVNNANWVSGDYIQFVIDRVGTYDGSGIDGAVFINSNESTAGVATTLDVIISTGTSITSVSGDDVIELGEQSCTIIGLNIASASSLNISKGGISENQTILSNTNNKIVFNVVNGAIVAGTGYTLSFIVGGTTYSKTVDFIAAGVGTNIASIGAADIIRKGDTNVPLVGVGLAAIEAVNVAYGEYTEVQTIVSITDVLILFNAVQRRLGYGAATLTVISDVGVETSFSVTLLPEITKDYVVLGTPSTGDASLTFNDSPAFTAGDIIEFDKVSANGFSVSVSNTGVPSIQGGQGQDSFVVRGYDASTGIWYAEQTVTFLGQGYFTRNSAPFVYVATLVGSAAAVGGEVVIPPEPEDDPTPTPLPDPTPDPTPEPDPTPDPAPVPNPEPNPEPEPEPDPVVPVVYPDDPVYPGPVTPVVDTAGETWVIQDDTDTDEVWT